MCFATNETALKRPGAACRRACRARLARVEAAGGAVCSQPSRITCLFRPQRCLLVLPDSQLAAAAQERPDARQPPLTSTAPSDGRANPSASLHAPGTTVCGRAG